MRSGGRVVVVRGSLHHKTARREQIIFNTAVTSEQIYCCFSLNYNIHDVNTFARTALGYFDFVYKIQCMPPQVAVEARLCTSIVCIFIA